MVKILYSSIADKLQNKNSTGVKTKMSLIIGKVYYWEDTINHRSNFRFYTEEGYGCNITIAVKGNTIVFLDCMSNNNDLFYESVRVILELWSGVRKIVEAVSIKFNSVFDDCAVDKIKSECEEHLRLANKEYKFDFISKNGVTA